MWVPVLRGRANRDDGRSLPPRVGIALHALFVAEAGLLLAKLLDELTLPLAQLARQSQQIFSI